MVWKASSGRTYLIRKSAAGAQKSLGPRTPETEVIFTKFQANKRRAEDRLKALKERADEQRKLNRLYGIGRTPAIVVRALGALEVAGLDDKFLVVGTQAIYAYETAAGVLVDAAALATRDLDLLFDTRKRMSFLTTLRQREEPSFIKVLQKADSSFRVMPNQLQTAVNDDGFEIDIIRRQATDGADHPMRMSEDEDDFWAAQVSQGQGILSARRFEHLVVSPTGEIATMRTVHPLDFIRLKQQLADRPGRGIKASKDRLQSQIVQRLWDDYLQHVNAQEDAR